MTWLNSTLSVSSIVRLIRSSGILVDLIESKLEDESKLEARRLAPVPKEKRVRGGCTRINSR